MEYIGVISSVIAAIAAVFISICNNSKYESQYK